MHGGRTSTVRGTSRVAGLVSLSAAALAACSSSGTMAPPGSAAALARVRQAVARTEDAGTAHLVQYTVTRSTLGGTSTQPVSEDSFAVVGDIRFAGPDLSLTITSRSALPSSASSSSSSSSTAPGTPSTTTSTSSSQSVYLGRHLYEGVPPGPVWTDEGARAPYAYLGAVPTRYLETVQGPVTVAGHRQIGGRPTTEYLVPVPRSEHDVPLTDSSNHSYTARFTTAPFTLAAWLDDAGRIIRTSGSEVITSSRPAGTVRETATTTLSAFGGYVHIAAPAVTPRG